MENVCHSTGSERLRLEATPGYPAIGGAVFFLSSVSCTVLDYPKLAAIRPRSCCPHVAVLERPLVYSCYLCANAQYLPRGRGPSSTASTKGLKPQVADSIHRSSEVSSKGLNRYDGIQPLVKHCAVGCLLAPVQLLILPEPCQATET